MASGYVYILINASLDGMVKVGRTTRDPQERRGNYLVRRVFRLLFGLHTSALSATVSESRTSCMSVCPILGSARITSSFAIRCILVSDSLKNSRTDVEGQCWTNSLQSISPVT